MVESISLWSGVLLAVVLVADIGMSLRPVRFIRDCLEGVGFPEDWWWSLLLVKATAVAGLLVGIGMPEVRAAAACGVVVYFLGAATAHVRARFYGTVFWVNCLGMLVFSGMTAAAAITAAAL